MTGDTPVNAMDEMDGNAPSASSTTTTTTTTTTSPMLPAAGVADDPSPPGSGVKHHRHRHKLKHRYRFDKTLGKGTYGKVKLATEISTGNRVAIKSIPKNKIEDPEDMRRIRQEIELMSTLDHPNIINIYEVFESKEKIVIVMEYASGGELYEFIDSTSIPLGEIQRLFRQIVSALAYCHLNNIVHRDLKLENVLLDQDGDAKIADFGLSSYYNDEDLLHTFCGSPLYASPEIVNGSPYHGPEVDCWSLGVILYAMIYKTMPFGGDDFHHLKRQIMEGRYYDPCPGTVQSQLIRHLLCIDPRYRATIYDVAHHPWVYGEDADEVLAMEYACSIGNRTIDSSRDRESTESSDTEIDGKPPPIPAKPKGILKGSSVEEAVVVAKEQAPEESQGGQELSSVEDICRDLVDVSEHQLPDLPKSVIKPESDSFLSLASSTATLPSSPEQSSAISVNGAFANLSPVESETEVETSAISSETEVNSIISQSETEVNSIISQSETEVNSIISQSETEVSSSAIQSETEVVKLRTDRHLRVQRPATVGALSIGDLPDLPSPRTLMKHLTGDDSVFSDDVVFEGSADDKRASARLSKRISCGKYSRITELWESVFNESHLRAMMSTPPSTQSRSKSLKVRREKGPEESPSSSSCEDLLDILNSQHLKKSYSGSFKLTRHRVASHRRSMRTHKEVAIQAAKKQKQQFQTEPLFAKQEFRKGTRDSGLGDDLENLAKVYQKALEISNTLD